ncbi:MAG TPA: L-threonylcarbamoyladenylate synthase [Pyrinomonadaceae bacterium]
MPLYPDNQDTRAQAARIIAAGGVIAYRTDTFYGLGADPLNQSAVRAIRSLKGREEAKPILLLISDALEIDRFIASHSNRFDRVVEKHWPGPLTLIGVARLELPVELTAGSGTIGLRLPADENVRALIRMCGGALTATSANVSGNPPAQSAAEVEAYFPRGIDLIINGGNVTADKPSTVVDLSTVQPRIIREGALSKAQLAESLFP